jgi:predicted ArsR family transcriptional regulator
MRDENVWVPEILRRGKRGVAVKIWTLLYLNQHRWFTAKEISGYLGVPLKTVQLKLVQLRTLPEILCSEIMTSKPGRKERRYRLMLQEYGFYY